MANVNRVLLIGNLTRDPEVRHTPGGTAVCGFGIAVNRKWTDRNTGQAREEVTFVDVEQWGKGAEQTGQYMSKGSAVAIEGRLRLDQWEDKKTGDKRSKLKVVADSVQFLDRRGDNNNDNDEDSF